LLQLTSIFCTDWKFIFFVGYLAQQCGSGIIQHTKALFHVESAGS
jgi:hypothetical protein